MLTDEQVKVAAERLCELRGVKPDWLCDIDCVNSLLWGERMASEVKSHAAIAEATGRATSILPTSRH